jgi:GTPase SAR1 family protein
MKAILIIGLPASGKSTYIESIKGDATVLDDFVGRDLPSIDRLIIADPYLCRERIRVAMKNSLELMGYSVEEVFYENDPDQCHINAEKRPDKEVDRFIDILSWEYAPPRVDRKVWNGQS